MVTRRRDDDDDDKCDLVWSGRTNGVAPSSVLSRPLDPFFFFVFYWSEEDKNIQVVRSQPASKPAMPPAAHRRQTPLRWSFGIGLFLGILYLSTTNLWVVEEVPSDHTNNWVHHTLHSSSGGGGTNTVTVLPSQPSRSGGGGGNGGNGPSTDSSSGTTYYHTERPEEAGKSAMKKEDGDSGGNDTEDDKENGVFPKGFQPHPNLNSDTYLRRGQPMDDTTRQALTDQWGIWTFVDPKKTDDTSSTSSSSSFGMGWFSKLSPSRSQNRPQDDYYAKYPSRDVPHTHFPSTAWQIDSTYLQQFLPQGQALVQRAQEAILTEYGYGTIHRPNESLNERANLLFHVEVSNRTDSVEFVKEAALYKEAGGAMTLRGWDGLVRRILHAILTQDTFRVVLGGHSAAAGHGNHFQQSYALQMQRVLEPVFARLGVTMTAHNLAMGGLGTLQSSLGAADIYSDDVDVLLYDTGMTEYEPEAVELFSRQGILSGGQKVPLLWVKQDFWRMTGSDTFQYLLQETDVDLGIYGTGMRDVPPMMTMEDAPFLPWATQYMRCDAEINGDCVEHGYDSVCWIDRDDVTPGVTQSEFVGGRASWHPGYRVHQLQGRVLAFTILRAMDQALEKWIQSPGYILEDEEWHVHDYYKSMRASLLSLNHTTQCHNQTIDRFPTRACDLPLRGRTEFTPRLNAHATSIRSLIKGGTVPQQVEPNLYDPPDVHNSKLDEGEVDLVNILENGVDFVPLLGRKRRIQERQLHEQRTKQWQSQGSSFNPDIQPGLGWRLDTRSAPDNCDGSYDSFCGRSNSEVCLLSGHNDYRGGLHFDGVSGWLILTLPQLRHGLITVKIEDWRDPNPVTVGWTCENNANCTRRLRGTGVEAVGSEKEMAEELADRSVSSVDVLGGRQLVAPYCPEFEFEFALDGQITTWNLEEWQARQQLAQRVVQLWTLLDDPDFNGNGGAPRDVELALRMKGCGRTKAFHLTHIYWA